jgi:ribosomal protein L31E
MATLERTYTIPLRREYQKVATYKRSKKAAKAIKEFAARHMKTPVANVKVLNDVNDFVWKHGIRNPPHHIKVQCRKDDKGIVTVQLFGTPFPEAAMKAPEKKGVAQKLAEKMTKKDEHKHDDAAHDHQHEEKKPEHKPAAPTPKPAPGHTPAQPHPTPVRKNPEQKH